MEGYIHSLQSLGTVDGPGVRAVIFSTGCPLRCIYCHNPDTWDIRRGTPTDACALAERIRRLIPYIKDGGVTFSGGEPCMQAEFFTELATHLRKMGLHIALDTSLSVWNDRVRGLIDRCDLILADLKFTTEQEYAEYCGGSLAEVLSRLEYVNSLGKEIWIRHVVVPSITDTRENILRLKALIKGYDRVSRVELLPFRKLCLEKYAELGIPFPLADTPEATGNATRELYRILNEG